MAVVKCDVLVVGAGPAGSMAAGTAAKKGAHVVVLERKTTIGAPVRCAEYIPAQLAGIVNLGREYVAQPIKGMRTFLPDGTIHDLIAPGFTIHRDRFDRMLAQSAVSAGAKILLSTSAVDLDHTAVTAKGRAGVITIYPEIIIGADGPGSVVSQWMGLKKNRLIPAVQVRVLLKKPFDVTEVYFHKDIYGGYGWLFPKKNQANVGLARLKNGPDGKSLNDLLVQFMDRLVGEGKIYPKVIKRFAGWIPAGQAEKITQDNMLLVGDAAGQTHPITGAGIAPAVICGQMAGKWAADAAMKKDVSLLTQYGAEYEEMFGESMHRAAERRTLMENKWGRLDQVIRKCWVAFREYYAGSR